MIGFYTQRFRFRLPFTVRDFKDLKELDWGPGVCRTRPRGAMGSTLYRDPWAESNLDALSEIGETFIQAQGDFLAVPPCI